MNGIKLSHIYISSYHVSPLQGINLSRSSILYQSLRLIILPSTVGLKFIKVSFLVHFRRRHYHFFFLLVNPVLLRPLIQSPFFEILSVFHVWIITLRQSHMINRSLKPVYMGLLLRMLVASLLKALMFSSKLSWWWSLVYQVQFILGRGAQMI